MAEKNAKKVLVAMSGGVDSSVAAYLLKQQGYTCIGATMKLFSNSDIGISHDKTCCSLNDTEDAKSVAFGLDMPYYVFNFSDSFRECVIDRFIGAYESGKTPNPCIDCNRYLKFDRLWRRAAEIGCDFVATGHYARVEYDPQSGRYLLKKAIDQSKDQSYVLYSMTQFQLAHTLFPLGSLIKSEVRKIAAAQGFVNSEKKDSQDICFVTDGDYADFIENRTGTRCPDGDFVDACGNVLGRHRGIIRYTVGQRKGLNISAGKPLYVLSLDTENNRVVLGDESELYTDRATLGDINLISVPDLKEPVKLRVKIRYRSPEELATVRQTDDDTLEICFEHPQRAVTKGQAAVLYDGDTLVGGGTIK